MLSIAVAIPIGRLIDRREARAMTVGEIALVGEATIAHSAISDLVGLIAAHAVLGLGLDFTVVGLQVIVAHAGPPDGADARFGLFAAAMSHGHVFGPLVTGRHGRAAHRWRARHAW